MKLVRTTRPNIFISGINNAKVSNAFETHLFNQRLEHPTLFIRQSIPTVVVGVNQNPFVECDLNELKKRNIELMRRETGGGTVCLDPGNLLIGFLGNLTQNPKLSKKCNNQIIIDSIRDSFSVEAAVSGRNDIIVDNKKVAGSAFRFDQRASKEDYILHHLSILVNADLSILPHILTPDMRKLQAKGVKSVSSRVANVMPPHMLLQEPFNFNFLTRSIVSHFIKTHNIENAMPVQISEQDMLSIPEVKQIHAKLNSDEWTYGNTPPFIVTFDERFTWGTIQIFLDIEYVKSHPIIMNVHCNTDSLVVSIPTELKQILFGQRYDVENIKRQFDDAIQFAETDEMIHIFNDLRLMFISELRLNSFFVGTGIQ